MELGNYISEQLAMFLRAILLGGTLGLIYDLLRTLRRLGRSEERRVGKECGS